MLKVDGMTCFAQIAVPSHFQVLQVTSRAPITNAVTQDLQT
jgi:hypothetical protein